MIFVTVFATDTLQTQVCSFFHNQIRAGMIFPNRLPTVSYAFSMLLVQVWLEPGKAFLIEILEANVEVADEW